MASNVCIVGFYDREGLLKAFRIKGKPNMEAYKDIARDIKADNICIVCRRWWKPKFSSQSLTKSGNEWKESKPKDEWVGELMKFLRQKGFIAYKRR